VELTDCKPIAGLAAPGTRDQLTPENLDWLRNLPQGPVHMEDLPHSQFVHGSPIDEDDYVVTARDALEPLLAFSVPLTFFGHTHLQGGFSANATSNDAFRPHIKPWGRQNPLTGSSNQVCIT